MKNLVVTNAVALCLISPVRAESDPMQTATRRVGWWSFVKAHCPEMTLDVPTLTQKMTDAGIDLANPPDAFVEKVVSTIAVLDQKEPHEVCPWAWSGISLKDNSPIRISKAR